MLSYSEVLARLADERSGQTAITQLRRGSAAHTVTWEELRRVADAGAAWLVASGVRPGDLVPNLLGNGWEAIAANFAIWRAGGCPLPLDPNSATDALRGILELVHAEVVLAHGPVLGLRVGTPEVMTQGTAGRSARLPAGLVAPHRKAIATSGTTRSPRVVVNQGRAELGASRTAIMDTVYGSLGMQTDQRQLIVASLSHNMGFDLAHFGLLAGHQLVLAPTLLPEDLFDLVRDYQIQYVGVPPYYLQRTVGLLLHRREELATLEAIKHSGSVCPVQVKSTWLAALGSERVFESYGMTEGYGRTVISGPEWLEHPGSVGRPWKSEAVVLGPSGPLPLGQVGRIAFTDLSGSQSVVLGDFASIESVSGHHATDDLGRLDDQGYLYLAGRATETVNVLGLQVSLPEVEAVVRNHPAVVDCLVGLDATGQLTALVVLSASAVARLSSKLRSHCLAHLNPHEVPMQFREVATIPRNAAWKPDRSLATALMN
ncbi:class I adenylate-forming enzyme family protein [Streptomyces sp. NPDC079020]|uniref:class I adenylate-forming enzyme family protein n=1 Tax=Streptomyces sp. NPDC079020 TaxID=3365722 RepID=UPI0037D2EF35